MGTPEFAVAPLEHLVVNGYQVVAVYTKPDKPAGRGRQQVSSPVKVMARALNLPVVQVASLKKAEAVAELGCFCPDIIVVAAYGLLLPRPVLELPRYGCINIHPSLLPRHRGASPIAAAILGGDEFTGVTIMVMNEGLDTGPVLTRAQIAISDGDNAGLLGSKLSLIAAHLLQDVLPAWKRHKLSPLPQDESRATYSGTVTKEGGEIDWRLAAADIWRQVRAFYPWPGSYTRFRGKMLKITGAMPLSGVVAVPPGRVVATASGFGVGSGNGVLGVLSVQMEGKRAMSAAEFIRGQRQLIGATLPG